MIETGTRWIARHRTSGDVYVVISDDDTITAMSAALASHDWQNNEEHTLRAGLDLFDFELTTLKQPVDAYGYVFVARQAGFAALCRPWDGA